MLAHDDDKFAIGRIELSRVKLTDWLLRRGKERIEEPAPTEPCACPFPLDETEESEPTVLTGHAIVEVSE